MESRNEHLLINYLDRTLEEKELREIEELINTDAEVRQQWQYLQLAVQAVQYVALNDQVAAVKEHYKTIHPSAVITEQQQAAPRRPVVLTRNIYSVAACLLFLVVAAAGYKYVTTSPAGLYKQAFIPYTLSTSRGNSTINDIEQAYRSKNWNQVIAVFDKTTQKDNKALFLTGMASLQLQQYENACKLFEQVLAKNAQTGDDYFKDEAQFYLAMSCLGENNIKEAVTILQKIRANKNHLYYQQANRISSTDLRIVAFKAGK
jgi:hypothetical protein